MTSPTSGEASTQPDVTLPRSNTTHTASTFPQIQLSTSTSSGSGGHCRSVLPHSNATDSSALPLTLPHSSSTPSSALPLTLPPPTAIPSESAQPQAPLDNPNKRRRLSESCTPSTDHSIESDFEGDPPEPFTEVCTYILFDIVIKIYSILTMYSTNILLD